MSRESRQIYTRTLVSTACISDYDVALQKLLIDLPKAKFPHFECLLHIRRLTLCIFICATILVALKHVGIEK